MKCLIRGIIRKGLKFKREYQFPITDETDVNSEIYIVQERFINNGSRNDINTFVQTSVRINGCIE
jgi:hypothetical protein